MRKKKECGGREERTNVFCNDGRKRKVRPKRGKRGSNEVTTMHRVIDILAYFFFPPSSLFFSSFLP